MGGLPPSVHILEIGTLSDKRHPTDILPFLPHMRPLFQQLPTTATDMSLRSVKIPLADIECVTGTQVRFNGPIWYLNIRKGKITRLVFQLCPIKSNLYYRIYQVGRERIASIHQVVG